MSVYRKEPNAPYIVLKETVRGAVCVDPNKCSHAEGLKPVLVPLYGDRAAETIAVRYEESHDLAADDKVAVSWDGEDNRHYYGTVEGNEARHLLMLNDKNKAELLKRMGRYYPQGISLVLTDVRSRPKQPATNPDPDVHSLKYAAMKGYNQGRTLDPTAARSVFTSGEVYATFTEEQRDAYDRAYESGVNKGPVPHRAPRRASTKGRIHVS